MHPSRRTFLKMSVFAGAGLVFSGNRFLIYRQKQGTFQHGSGDMVLDDMLEAEDIPKYETPLLIPPAMPKTASVRDKDGVLADYYILVARQFRQQILPPSMGLEPTTVWGYGSKTHPSAYNSPSFTIEASYATPVRVKWVNGLVDSAGDYLPHLLPVDQTIHWANPGGMRDMESGDQTSYRGPVPIVTHLHGAHTADHSDGYTEAWYLPAARNIPTGYYTVGSWYDTMQEKFVADHGQPWSAGAAVAQYPNNQRAGTLWFHDHTLGMTRLNVYAGLAGFYLVRGGPSDLPAGVLPGPAPALGDAPGTRYYEVPIAIQDRTFQTDGSLFYPDNRAFFEGLELEDLQIPFAGDPACDGVSDVPPIWNPEFFGTTMMVNGQTWPYLEVEQRRYRLRFLNGCNSRFLILKFDRDLPFWRIGSEGGFLRAPVEMQDMLLAPSERADVIVDFAGVPDGATITLLNLAPDEPYGGGRPGEDFEPAGPKTTGQIMQFRVVPATSADTSTPPQALVLPEHAPLGEATYTRKVSLNEEMSRTVFVREDDDKIIFACDAKMPFGPVEADLGIVNDDGTGTGLRWEDPVTENPALNAIEIWEIYNFTSDAHPIHLHEVMFEVIEREPFNGDPVRPAEPWEQNGVKDSVNAFPGEITRIKAKFDLPGRYVWHCHIVEHEDNEMMRPMEIG